VPARVPAREPLAPSSNEGDEINAWGADQEPRWSEGESAFVAARIARAVLIVAFSIGIAMLLWAR
jgi:hypothetical protein